MQVSRLIAFDNDLNLQAWSVFDHGAQVYELFLDPNGETYIGCADTHREAVQIATQYFKDVRSW
jgi:hypothetical protein